MSESLKGKFLVASPALLTPFFTKTVILMFEHNEQGAMGVVLNRATEASVASVSEQVFSEAIEWDKAIHLGGPVPGPLLVLHTVADLADQMILEGVYSTFEPAKVEALLRSEQEPSLVLANYSGWGPGQLEGEIAEDSWLSLEASLELVFGSTDGDAWESVMRRIRGVQLREMFGIETLPSDPSAN